MRRYLTHGLFFLLGATLSLGISHFSNARSVLNNKNLFAKQTPEVIAPYYDPEVFLKPEGLTNSSSRSAKLKIPIIMYHYVEQVKDHGDFVRKSLNINPHLFEQQIVNLKEQGYSDYFVKDIPDILAGVVNYASSSAVLTFDDGYEDFYTVVFPLLKKYNMRATVYIAYNFIGKKGFLTENQIRELIESDLVEIGSHTLDHVSLKSARPDVAKEQIFGSKEKLEERFGIKIKTFAYPYGSFDAAAERLVKEASYSAAVSVIPGSLQSQDNLFYLSRIRPGLFTGTTVDSALKEYEH
ncbi:hypothetical protein COT62_01915 [Candidatus Roizmanbacteria bacterium CG09_land_8_20_14_0_10_41_9]|uniref:NodB homology domain-containing protein n=1 Tax=Candidatus Roizmanbacteria bacterium CG09_land_8_20_14_0_10_41_9 TaxID=1974850 RepID=A0A2H0WT26_9BACT|nr:MAG: hypothetical protein COT62_01915 [Candidatus Roizmanbacteria bacterium CG09_land_8_20_14_0_10_41_9]